MNDVTVNVPGITWRKITDQICTAIEGGADHWLESFQPRPEDKARTTERPWYADEKVWSEDFSIRCKVENNVRIFDREAVNRGLQWLAANHLWRLEEIVKETGDAETADVFLQACVLGDIVYG